MQRAIFWLVFLLGVAGFALAQVDQLPSSGKGPGPSQAPPRYEHDSSVSSSRDTKVDISPPADDAKNHPNSSSSVADAEEQAASDVQEMHPWNPHKAAKDLEVGDFYFKRKNYRAALDRYQEALLYKPNDAVTNFHLGECYEKLDDPDQSTAHYQAYLKILPHGPLAEKAQKAIDQLKREKAQASTAEPPKQ